MHSHSTGELKLKSWKLIVDGGLGQNNLNRR